MTSCPTPLGSQGFEELCPHGKCAQPEVDGLLLASTHVQDTYINTKLTKKCQLIAATAS